MKTFSDELKAALDAGAVMVSGAVKIAMAEPVLAWGGYHTLEIEGEDYLPLGADALIKATSGQLGSAEQSIELSLSGLDPLILTLADTAEARRAAVVVWRLFFDSAGVNLLGAHRYAAGRVDTLATDETPGGTASIKARVKTAAAGQGRMTGRMRSDADQRLFDPTDGSLKWVTSAPSKTLAWGGKPPNRAGASLPNLTGGGGGLGNLDLSGVRL